MKRDNNADFHDIISDTCKISYNLVPAKLAEIAVIRGEGIFTDQGALSVKTGKYTGRSPNDKYIVVSPSIHTDIDWNNNKKFDAIKFENLYNRMIDYMQNREVFIFYGYAGADEKYRIAIKFINEYAWQSLFVNQIFIQPKLEEKEFKPDFKLICLPGFKAIPEIDGTDSEVFVVINFECRIVLIGGTHYAGEIKKSIFTVMNFFLPTQGVLPMHCSANIGVRGDTTLFFGLSGTGKTTLSADPQRRLIGDDEHGWSKNGIFNIEGGCYAKCINLSRKNEPQIWDAIHFGTILENVDIDSLTCYPNFKSDKITENTRAAYPLKFISNAIIPSRGNHPKTIIFLTADAFGVLPPISKLNKEQAIYHFLLGYTSKLAGTEYGIIQPQATFSSCFGAPFLPLSPLIYAKMLRKKLEEHNTNVFLINTGWSGGPYGIGERINLTYTRKMVTAAVERHLDNVDYISDPIFNLKVPVTCPGIPSTILNPRNIWKNIELYDKQAIYLSKLFKNNFKKFI